ncbi:MAG: hypothetical protein M3128_02000 [Verrucomicrobiota bacterium]|nr:hypothetical protein [Verrucomicrobiota bacterium]
MNVIDEITALKKVVEILAPLEDPSRRRVLAYAGSAYADKPIANIAGTSEAIASRGSGSRDESRSDKPVPPQEYLRNYNYKVMTKRIAVMGVYLERERQMKRFGFRDITDAFRIAKEPKVPAQSQYARAVIMGYLAKEGDQYYATTQAEALVDKYAPNGEDVSV